MSGPAAKRQVADERISRLIDEFEQFDHHSHTSLEAICGHIPTNLERQMHLSSLRHSSFPSDLLVKGSFDSNISKVTSNSSVFKSNTLPVPTSLPSPPMSGSPPPPSPPDISRTTNLRRKRSLSDNGQADFTLGRTVYEPIARPHEYQPRYSGELPSQVSAFPGPFQPGFGSGYVPAAGTVGLQSSVYPPVRQTLLSQPDVPGPTRATRKLKAHVASACVNCKKKHLRCDNARPCNRCVQSGKEHTCVDVTHKKRGRPPLKVDEAHARRAYETSIGPLNVPNMSTQGQGMTSSSYTQAGLGVHSRDTRRFPSPGPTESRRRPPPLFEPQNYGMSQVAPSTNHPLSSESSLSSNKPPSPYYTSPPLLSPSVPQMQQSRFDPYGRPYAQPPIGFTTFAPPPNQRVSPQLRQYQSISSISSSTSTPSSRPDPPPFIASGPIHPSGPASSSIQLPPIHPSLHVPAPPPSVPGTSHSYRRESGSSANTTSSLPQQEHSTEDTGHDAKRQRMDLGGMLRRSET